MSSALRLGAYLLVAVLGAAELSVLWLAANPDVPPSYRAYYLDRTTTCLDIPVSGEYAGGVLSFYDDGREATRPTKVCGWEGPAGDGTHAVGTSSRLRFELEEAVPDPVLAFEMVAVAKGDVTTQRVDVLVNGEPIGEVTVASGEPQSFVLPLGPEPAEPGTYEVTFEFPDALRMGATDPETRWRSIKLGAAGIVTRSEASAQTPAAS